MTLSNPSLSLDALQLHRSRSQGNCTFCKKCLSERVPSTHCIDENILADLAPPSPLKLLSPPSSLCAVAGRRAFFRKISDRDDTQFPSASLSPSALCGVVARATDDDEPDVAAEVCTDQAFNFTSTGGSVCDCDCDWGQCNGGLYNLRR